MAHRKSAAEALGTALLVFVAVGVATLGFGFKVTGQSASAGVVTTALAFGLVLALAYTLGPVSGGRDQGHPPRDDEPDRHGGVDVAAGYLAAQLVGGIAGALGLWAILSGAPGYSGTGVGLGADRLGGARLDDRDRSRRRLCHRGRAHVRVRARVLIATSRVGSPSFAGLAIGLALTVVHLIGIPLTGTSVNPARSLGPALIVGDKALSQVWLFIVAPLIGGAVAALVYRYFVPPETAVAPTEPSAITEGVVERTTATP